MHKLKEKNLCPSYTNETLPGLLSHILNVQFHSGCYCFIYLYIFFCSLEKSCLSGDFVGVISLTLAR